jgi:cell division protein FtsW
MLPRRAIAPPVMYDRLLVVLVASLVIVGLLMVASASIVMSDMKYHQPFYFFYRQLVICLVGIALGSIVIQFEIDLWEKIDGTLLMAVMVMLALVLLPGVGRSVNGSARWLGISFFSVQVSELAKFAVVIYMAGYLVRRSAEIKNQFSGFLKPMGILAVIAILLLKEPDFGATAVIMATALGMMFLAGMQLRPFIVIFAFVLIALSVLAISEPYRMHRLTTFLNPWANPFSGGYQLTQSLIAFGRGGVLGVGLGNSIQKLFYLPEAHTDFLFAVIAEELGLAGVIGVIMLFTLLVVRILFIGRQAQQLGKHFAGYMAYGFGLWIAIQFIVSVGVNTGVLPTKGLTMPLVSYGGNSMLITCIVIALLFRIDYENRMTAMGLS